MIRGICHGLVKEAVPSFRACVAHVRRAPPLCPYIDSPDRFMRPIPQSPACVQISFYSDVPGELVDGMGGEGECYSAFLHGLVEETVLAFAKLSISRDVYGRCAPGFVEDAIPPSQAQRGTRICRFVSRVCAELKKPRQESPLGASFHYSSTVGDSLCA